eukprot:TRINITY_DN7582_c0_g1_i4.p1 TRINITY_DN7582_c0_g1~~TRINITY_DN7582_c0_g1_i4.p1  ORF type:complete len:1354 (+),score=381.46 TRINITY_DN7582_c0_g1_i4:54-4115(+)
MPGRKSLADSRTASAGRSRSRSGSTMTKGRQSSRARDSLFAPPTRETSHVTRAALFFRSGKQSRGIGPRLRGMVNALRAVEAMQSDSGQTVSESEARAREEADREEQLLQNRMAARAAAEKGSFGETDLMRELVQDRVDLQRLTQLLQHRAAAVHVGNAAGRTPAHLGASVIEDKTKMEGALRLLINAGASLHIADKSGLTPLSQLENFDNAFANNVLKVVKRFAVETASRQRQRVVRHHHSVQLIRGGVGGQCIPSTVWPNILYCTELGNIACSVIPAEPRAESSPPQPAVSLHVPETDDLVTHLLPFSFSRSTEWLLTDTGLLLELTRSPDTDDVPEVASASKCPHLAFAGNAEFDSNIAAKYEAESMLSRRLSFPSARAEMRAQGSMLSGVRNCAVLVHRGSLCWARVRSIPPEPQDSPEEPVPCGDPMWSMPHASSGLQSGLHGMSRGERHPLTALLAPPGTKFEFEVYMFPPELDSDSVVRKLRDDSSGLRSGTRFATMLEERPTAVMAAPPRHFVVVPGPGDIDQAAVLWNCLEPTLFHQGQATRAYHNAAAMPSAYGRGMYVQVADAVEVMTVDDDKPVLHSLLQSDGTAEERYHCVFHPTESVLAVLRSTTASRELCVMNTSTGQWSFVARLQYVSEVGEYPPKHIGSNVSPAVNNIQFTCNGKHLIRHNASLGTAFVYDWERIAADYCNASDYMNVVYCPPPSDGFALRADGSAPPPTGLVTLSFTDVQSSTHLWEHAEESMAEALEMHNNLLREEILEWSGYEVKTEGDSFMVAFASPLDCLNWCLSVQLKLLSLPWPPKLLHFADASCEWNDARMLNRTPGVRDSPYMWRGLRVRMGIHTGKPSCALDPVTGRMDYFGPVVNLAARVSGKGKGGQVVVSGPSFKEVGEYCFFEPQEDAAQEEAADASQAAGRSALQARTCCRVAVESLGEHRFKGISKDVKIYQVLPLSLSLRNFSPAEVSQALPLDDQSASASASPLVGVSSPVGSVLQAGEAQDLLKKLEAGSTGLSHTESMRTNVTGVDVRPLARRRSLGRLDLIPPEQLQLSPKVSTQGSFRRGLVDAAPTRPAHPSPSRRASRPLPPSSVLASLTAPCPAEPMAVAFDHSKAATALKGALTRTLGDNAQDLLQRVEGLTRKCSAMERFCLDQRNRIEELQIMCVARAETPKADGEKSHAGSPAEVALPPVVLGGASEATAAVHPPAQAEPEAGREGGEVVAGPPQQQQTNATQPTGPSSPPQHAGSSPPHTGPQPRSDPPALPPASPQRVSTAPAPTTLSSAMRERSEKRWAARQRLLEEAEELRERTERMDGRAEHRKAQKAAAEARQRWRLRQVDAAELASIQRC